MDHPRYKSQKSESVSSQKEKFEKSRWRAKSKVAICRSIFMNGSQINCIL